MKYRNTFGTPRRKGRAALLLLALAAALLALHGAPGHSGASAQENSRKQPRTNRLDSNGGAAGTAQRAARPAGKSLKADKAAAASSSDGPASSLGPCFPAGRPISFGQTINEALDGTDCVLTQIDNSPYDVYTFMGTAGQQVSVRMESGTVDSYLFLILDLNDNGQVDDAEIRFGRVGEDDDGFNVSRGNARIPSTSGFATLPSSARYFILANSVPPDVTGAPPVFGNYSVTLTQTNGPCGAVGGITVGGAPVNGSLGAGDCRFVDDSFFDAYSFTGNAGQQISITLTSTFTAGNQEAAPFVFLLDSARNILALDGGTGNSARIPSTGVVTLPSTGTYFVVANSTPRPDPLLPTPTGNYTLTVANAGQCPTSAITGGQTVNGSLAGGDCVLINNTLADFYTFSGTAGQQVAIAMSSEVFDTYLILNRPDGTTLAENDDGGSPSDTDSRIPAGSTPFITLPVTGTYTILANSFGPGATGAYTLTLTQQGAATSTIQFSPATHSVTEGVDRSVVVIVTRTGDTTSEAFVSYATNDGSFASERKDYTAALGRLRFAPGQNSKTFEIVLTDDAFAEGQETFTVTLSNPSGAALGATTTAVVTINSNDGANGPSPVRDASFNTEFFVRQHYADFLNRVPDAGGLQFWINNIESCGADQSCREVRKVDTSAAFFLSIEFQETGFLAVRTHKVAFGNLPGKPVPLTIRSFLFDSRQIGEGVVVGTPGWPEQLELNKVAYFNEFVTRADFLARYPTTMTAEAYVDQLFATADVLPTTAERNAAINAFNTSGRAAALRSVAESQTLKAAETNRAFVLMQYFGYLRRNPDDTDFRGIPDPNFEGYNFWLTKLTQFGGNYVDAEMVKAFIQSIEYGDRFGQ